MACILPTHAPAAVWLLADVIGRNGSGVDRARSALGAEHLFAGATVGGVMDGCRLHAHCCFRSENEALARAADGGVLVP